MFIKLTNSRDIKFYMNYRFIRYIWPRGTESNIYLNEGEIPSIEVKEGPEEILKRIEFAQANELTEKT